MYDIAIIGSGPAGLSAALNLKLHNKSIIWFGSKKLSEKVERSEKIANYPGVPMVEGPRLNKIFSEQLADMGLELTEQMITSITQTRRGFSLLGANEIYDARAILLAIGASSARGFSGEEELLGRGVSYCATCDGFLYKGKKIAVFCSNERYYHEVEYLAELAESVCLFCPDNRVSFQKPNIIKSEKPLKEILGDTKVRGIKLTDGTEIELDGVFILRDSVAPASLMRGLELEGVNIKVNSKMQTNKKGCFAAGDCTGRPYQIASAVGEGNTAAHSILEYLSQLDKE